MSNPKQIRLIIDKPSGEQLGHIFNAEKELRKAGITFDTGSDLGKGIILSRVWELDWSLKGARVVVLEEKQ